LTLESTERFNEIRTNLCNKFQNVVQFRTVKNLFQIENNKIMLLYYSLSAIKNQMVEITLKKFTEEFF